MPSKYERKRKKDLDSDTTKFDGATGREKDEGRTRRLSRSPKKSRKDKHHDEDKGGDKNEESLSIEETNKLRAKLGLAPLELEDDKNTEPVEKEDGSGEKVFSEYGIEIVHKPSRNWADEKRQKELKNKLETKKKQREVYGKVLKARRGLAEDSDDEDGDTAKWVEKNRRLEEEMKKAQEKAKQLDEMDEAFGIGGLLQQAGQQKREQRSKKKNEALTSGLVVGHSVTDFSEGRETILVLEDKSILDDEEDEMLVNPNMLENERHKANVEKRKKTATHYHQQIDEEMDEFGQVKKPEILAKYNEGLDGDGKKRETFRLDATGKYDLDREQQEAEAKHRLMIINKKFESLEATKYTLANEFYTEEEIIKFRRPKKGKGGDKKMRKKKKSGDNLLKADDLQPMESMEETADEKKAREAKLAARRAENGSGNDSKFKETLKETKTTKMSEEIEEGELADEFSEKGGGKVKKAKTNEDEEKPPILEEKEKWKKPKATVNVKMLESLAEKMKKRNRQGDEEEEESDDEEDEFPHTTNVVPIRIDDEAEDELNAMLAKERRMKQAEMMLGNSRKMPTIPEEEESSDEEDEGLIFGGRKGTTIIFDATSEKYKSIGGGGYSGGKDMVKMEENGKEEEDEEMDEETMLELLNKEVKKERKRRKDNNESDNDDERIDEGERRPESSQSDSSSDMPGSSNYTNILGEEKDVTKGVAAMLKLADEKGYLESGDRRRVGEGSLRHLESKRYSRVEQGRLDIEDKTMRKLERMGTTGTGPTRPFPEKPDYKPNIEITYSDKSGRVLEPKEAFRALSWKFHGKGPGKKQAEKHTMKVVKREKMKKMNSQDTPLGTLNKQLKKQEQMQTPYLVLTGRAEAAPLQKE